MDNSDNFVDNFFKSNNMTINLDFSDLSDSPSTKRPKKTESKNLDMTFEDYLKKKGIWELYKDDINTTKSQTLNDLRKEYENEMSNRYCESIGGGNFLDNWGKVFSKTK